MLIYEEAMAAALRSTGHQDEIAVVSVEANVVQSIRYLQNEKEFAELFSE